MVENHNSHTGLLLKPNNALNCKFVEESKNKLTKDQSHSFQNNFDQYGEEHSVAEANEQHIEDESDEEFLNRANSSKVIGRPTMDDGCYIGMNLRLLPNDAPLLRPKRRNA